MQKNFFISVVIFCALASACDRNALNINPNDAQQIARGKTQYDKHCARCHGDNLQGEPDWKKRKPDGKLPAPPHDETGHTWHHADALLVGIIKQGLVPPYAPPNYVSDMPAFAQKLSDNDIADVLSFIKSRWPADIQEQHTQINRATSN